MKYNVELGPKAEKFLQKTKDSVLLKRIFQKLILLEKDPKPEDAQIIQGSDYHRVRVGDYRIVYKVEDGELRVIIAMIGHRRDIYEKFFR